MKHPVTHTGLYLMERETDNK